MDESLSQQISSLRKSGNLTEAWKLGCQAVQDHPNDMYIKSAFFWVCYEYLKKVQSSLKERVELGGNRATHAPTSTELKHINSLLDRIIKLDIPPGGIEYRRLLLIFQKNLEYIPKLVVLLFNHSSNLFNDEDKQPYINEKGEFPSLMLKFSRKVAEAWIENEEVRQLTIDEICLLFSKTRHEAKDKQHKIWLDHDEAKCLIRAKRFDQARDYALVVLKSKQAESWAWAALATTFREEDQDAAIVLFSKALCCVNDDSFALPILKDFALLLAEQNFDDEASMCVNRAVDHYVKKDWKIKPDLARLMNQPWYHAEVDLELLSSFLEKQAVTALDFLFGKQEQRIAVVRNIHASGKGFHAYLSRHQSIAIRLGLYSLKNLPSPGDYVRLTLSAEEQSPIAAEPCDPENMDDVSYQEGTLNIKANGFGFVDDTYVPKDLVKQDMDGQIVKVLRILDFNRKKNSHGWKALTIEVI